jgi:hypothetical protein
MQCWQACLVTADRKSCMWTTAPAAEITGMVYCKWTMLLPEDPEDKAWSGLPQVTCRT